ncbi:uncharacterized protein LOC119860913 [Dermochelys coriacea]|uniref:uncharacterized protein LOC119860913 n=1 Tax=Dermochelys coriacea TaxID=27794 RepID=UPI0018E87C68|nr:uncharacterized protein LOC119860913 [Dermochelys coriacea]
MKANCKSSPQGPKSLQAQMPRKYPQSEGKRAGRGAAWGLGAGVALCPRRSCSALLPGAPASGNSRRGVRGEGSPLGGAFANQLPGRGSRSRGGAGRVHWADWSRALLSRGGYFPPVALGAAAGRRRATGGAQRARAPRERLQAVAMPAGCPRWPQRSAARPWGWTAAAAAWTWPTAAAWRRGPGGENNNLGSPTVSNFRQLRAQLVCENLNADKLSSIMRQDSLEPVVRDPCYLLNQGICNSNIDQTLLSILLLFHRGIPQTWG